MPLDFPAAPPPLVVGQVYGQWKWDGSKWVAAAQSYATSPYQPGPGLTINAGTTPPTIDVAKPYLPIDGSVAMTGANLLLSADPTASLGAATKNYVDNHSGAVYIGDTAPTVPAPRNGSLWWNSIIGQLLIYYTDVNSSQWIQANVVQAAAGLVLPVTVAQGGTGVTTLAANVLPKGAGTAPLASSTITDGGSGVTIGSPAGGAQGAGTLSLPGSLVVNANAAATTAPYAGTLIHLQGVDGTGPQQMIEAYGAVNGDLAFRQAAGTGAAPTATQTGYGLGRIQFAGYAAAGWSTVASAAITANAIEPFSATAAGANIVFNTCAAGTLTTANRMTIRTGVVIGNTSGDPGQGGLTLNANAATLPGGAATPAALRVANVDGSGTVITMDSFGAGTTNTFAMRMARGTGAAQTAAQSGDVLGSFNFYGYGATTYAPAAGQITLGAIENFTDSAHGSVLGFNTTPPGTVTLARRMSLYNGLYIGNVPSDPGVGCLVCNANAAALPAGVSSGNPQLLVAGTDGNSGIISQASFGGQGCILNFWHAAGTAAAPTAVAAGQGIGVIESKGFDGTAWSGPQAQIGMFSINAWTTSDHSAQLVFYVTPATSTSQVQAMTMVFGVQVGAPTGGDKGGGSVNASSMFVNGAAVSTSDARLKERIAPTKADALAVLRAIPLYEFDWRSTGDDDPNPRHNAVGFVAQELPDELEHLVVRGRAEEDPIGVDGLQLTAHLVRAVQQIAERLEKAGIYI